MAKHILMALNGANAGEEAEFERWYDEVHIPEILAVPGCLFARRFRIVNTDVQGGGGWSNVSLYEIETDDLPATLAALHGAISPSSTAIDSSTSANLIGSEIRAFTA
ncbi:hypothetical protein BH10PSE13_BH10PSE13_03530 [soil metagenome]